MKTDKDKYILDKKKRNLKYLLKLNCWYIFFKNVHW